MEAEPSTEVLMQSSSRQATAWASSQHDLSLHQELIKSLRSCSSESDGEGIHKIVQLQKRESRGNIDTLKSKAMPGALVSNRHFLFWHFGWKMHTKVVCVSVNTLFNEEKYLH